MPIIIQIDYYLFEMKVCEASLEKKSTFKDVKQILRQGRIPFSKTTTPKTKLHKSIMEKMTSIMCFLQNYST